MRIKLAFRLAATQLAAAATCLAVAAPASAFEPSFRWRGYLKADYRPVPEDGSFERLEATVYGKLSARLSEHVAAVANLRLVLTHYPTSQEFAELFNPLQFGPLKIESDNLFVEFIDMGLEGLDLRIGRQQKIWGSANRFHTASKLNALDLEEPLAFGTVLATEMVALSYRPELFAGDEDEPWFDELALQLAWVPVFRPALLPQSGMLAFDQVPEFKARANTDVLLRMVNQQASLILAGWDFTYRPRAELPEVNLANSQLGARLSFRLLDIDMGFTYFRGFDDFPRAENILVDVQGTSADADIQLTWPRTQIVGFDVATSLPFLDGLGLWGEVGVTFHDDLFRTIVTGPVIGVNEAELEVPAGHFVKAVVGIDYSPTSWMYFNVQYLHGFPDEFGPESIENYLVGGVDFKLGADAALIRLFAIVNLDDPSYALFPQVVITPWSGGELTVGALLYAGLFTNTPDPSKKFESVAVGPSFIFVQAKASF